MVTTTAFTTVKADIPHENYEYVSSDLGVVVSLLNTSILYFESSLTALYDEDIFGGIQNLSAVNALLGPVEGVLDELAGIAESYDNLSSMIPAFAELADKEDAFIDLEDSLIDAREVLRSLSGRSSLTDNETISAMTAFNEASVLISQMSAAIDSMIATAVEITSLSVEGEHPFSENNLVDLIESLRDLLYYIEVELVNLIEGEDGDGGGSGISIDSFLTLWVSNASLYLGDGMTGGGYLYFDGSFHSGHEVTILRNGSTLLTAATSSIGAFAFDFYIPLESSWLGTHELIAFSSWSDGNLTSDPVIISVDLIPTTITLFVDEPVLSPLETLLVTVILRDVRGGAVANEQVSLTIDDSLENVSVDSQGSYSASYLAGDLGMGEHTFASAYGGGMPYAPCESSNVTVKIDIPTSLELTLYSEEVYLGYYLVGEGVLSADGPEPLEGMRITLLIDGLLVRNATTDENGTFVFSISTGLIAVGDHVLKAEFAHEDAMWRHSEDEVEFRIYTTERTAKYPFWPIIPGWGNLGAPPEVAYNLFFGDYAYFGWLLMVGIIVVAVKTVRMRREALARRSLLVAALSDRGPDGVKPGGLFAETPKDPDPFNLAESPDAPNEKIVWSYNYLLGFLVRNRRVQIGASMTHREIARMLETFGYPTGLVNRVTTLFEMARYSGTPMTESEMNTMGSVVEQLKSTVLGVRTHAA